MQVIILAAGRGKRLRPLTDVTPKPLIMVRGKSILERTLAVLPDVIDEVIVVVSYLGDQVRERFGDRHNDRPIRYVNQGELAGTAGALWAAKELLRPEKFLVLNGDDLYRREDLERLLGEDLALGVHHTRRIAIGTLGVAREENGNFSGIGYASETELWQGVPVITGAYILDHRFFTYKPFKIENAEYGLPHTIAAMAGDHAIRVVPMDFWHPINTHEHLKLAEELLQETEG